MAALCGLPVAQMVSAEPVEAAMWNRVTKRAGELRVQLIRLQANHNAAAIAQLFKRR